MTTQESRLGQIDRLAYAAPALGLAAVGIPLYVHLPKFYTDIVGVGVATVGFIIAAVRVFDAVSDPLLGVLSDRMRSRWGRRRPLIFVASPLLAISLLALLSPPAGATAAWFAAWMFATFAAWTLMTVPYEALGAELTADYDERTGILAMRDGALLLGTLVAAAAPIAVGAWLGSDGPDAQRRIFSVIGIGYGSLLVATATWCVRRLRERPPQQAKDSKLRVRDVLANRPFRILVIAYVIGALGSNLPSALFLYYVQYVLQSSAADGFLALYLGTGVLALPLWIPCARRFGKRRTWIASMLVNTGAFLGVYFLGPGQVVAYGILVFLSGLGLGATLAIPSSMQADVIDYDELLSGSRREGLYVGVWSISRKLAAAVGVGAALPILAAVGYTPNVAQSETVVSTLRILYALVPGLCNLVAIGVAWYYPIGRAEHSAILAATADRAHVPVTDPLTGQRLEQLT
jgi:GPH family glycoside/pentoside/hexuronide:cation symporter